MKIYVGSTDITDFVIDGSYNMDSAPEYESFIDGNKVEHRIYTAEKISGKFELVLAKNKNGMSLSEFIALWNSHTTNGYTQLTVYVTNVGTIKTINAYCSITNKEHKRLPDGTYLDIIDVKVEER